MRILVALILLALLRIAAPHPVAAQEADDEDDEKVEEIVDGLKATLHAMDDSASVEQPALRHELWTMMERSEAHAERLARERPAGRPPLPAAPTDSSAVAHGRRLVSIVGRHGWPARELVGRTGAMAAHVLFRHHIDATALEHLLPVFLEAFDENGGHPYARATLEDEAPVKLGLPQRYGSQVCESEEGVRLIQPADDRAAINARRISKGWTSLDEALRSWSEGCPCPVVPRCPE